MKYQVFPTLTYYVLRHFYYQYSPKRPPQTEMTILSDDLVV